MDSTLTTVLVIFLISIAPSAFSQVITDPEVTLWAGKNGELTCQYTGSNVVNLVTWTYGATNVPLITWSPTLGALPPDPEQYEYDPRMNMTNDWTLLIENVALADEGAYRCIVRFADNSFLPSDETTITVYAAPDEPYPTIAECLSDERANGTAQQCILEVRNETETFNLTCEARDFLPNITLTWTSGSRSIEPLSSGFWMNPNGTGNVAVTIEASANPTPYVCTAKGDAIRDGPKTAGITIRLPVPTTTPTTVPPLTTYLPDDNPSSQVGLWVGIALIIVVGILVLVFVGYKLYPRYAAKRTEKKVTYKEVAQKPREDEEKGVTSNDDMKAPPEEDVKSPEKEPLESAEKVSVDVNYETPNDSGGNEPVTEAAEATESVNA